MEIRSRYQEILERIEAAAARSGRSASAITMIAVAKTVPPDAVRAAFEAGIRDFGENRAQELVSKYAELAGLPLRWHFIGHLQTNKVRQVVAIATMIHSVDSLHLAQRIDDLAPEGRVVDLLLQVNTSREATKYGLPAERVGELAAAIGTLPGVRLRGLMTLGPWTEDAGTIRSAFRLLRNESERLRVRFPDATILSMGMSGDFEIAIEEGATHIRVGTALFGPRG